MESQPEPNGGLSQCAPDLPPANARQAAAAVDQPLNSKPVEAKPSPAARAGKTVNPFAQHAGERKIRTTPARTQEPPAQRLMTWLPRWPKATISVRDVRLFGPNSLRDPEIASDAVEILAGFGWLIPVETRRRDMKWWQIVRGRGEDETVATPSVAQP
jgi:hypothetical protein